MHVLLTQIDWKTDGESLADCRLPEQVVALDVPAEFDVDQLGSLLQEAFGFIHCGYKWEKLSEVHDSHAGGGFYPSNLGVIRYEV